MGQSAGAGGGDGVVDSAAAVDDLAPRLQGAVVFEAVQDGVDDTFAEGDEIAAAAADGLHDLIAVHLLLVEKLEDEEFGDAVHEVRVGIAGGHCEIMIPRGSRYGKEIMLTMTNSSERYWKDTRVGWGAAGHYVAELRPDGLQG